MAGYSLGFISDLPLTRNKKDSILTVVDNATENTNLVLCREDVTESEAANLIWTNILELHSKPRTIASDR